MENIEAEKKNSALCERSHKITEALYRVTGLFSDKEPLKWQLRNNAIEILDFLAFLEDKDFFDVNPLLNLINKMNRNLQLASSSSAYFSSMNFEVLRREYLLLSEEIKQTISPLKIELPQSPLAISNGHSIEYNRYLSDKENIPNGHNGHLLSNDNDKESNNNSNNNNKEKESIGQPPVLLRELKEREKKILDLIKGHDWISVHEIYAFLPEYSEKGIQRDILEMVDGGILKKTGDKRWRKYSIA